MDKVERCHVCLSLFAGIVLGLAIGVATHWGVGALIFLAWVAVHGMTWGFAQAKPMHDERLEPDPETFS